MIGGKGQEQAAVFLLGDGLVRQPLALPDVGGMFSGKADLYLMFAISPEDAEVRAAEFGKIEISRDGKGGFLFGSLDYPRDGKGSYLPPQMAETDQLPVALETDDVIRVDLPFAGLL